MKTIAGKYKMSGLCEVCFTYLCTCEMFVMVDQGIVSFQAELLTGLSVQTIEDAEKAVIMILERGAGKVIITLGSKGSVIGSQENRIPKHLPVTPAEPVDTTVC